MRYFLCLLFVPLLAQSREGLVRTPEDMVDGNRLIEKVWRFTISAPEGWSWYNTAEDNTYVAFTPWSSEQVTVDLDYKETANKPLEDEMPTIIRNLIRLHTDKGYLITEQGFLLKDGPFPMAAILLKGQNEIGDPLYIHYYVIRAGDLYRVHSITESAKEPAFLSEMMSSFRLLALDGKPLPLENSHANDSDSLQAGDEVAERDTPASTGRTNDRVDDPVDGPAPASKTRRIDTTGSGIMLVPVFMLAWGLMHLICWAAGKVGWEWDADRITQGLLALLTVLSIITHLDSSDPESMSKAVGTAVVPFLIFFYVIHTKIKKDQKKAMNAGPPVKGGRAAEQKGDHQAALATYREAGASDPAAWVDYLRLALTANSREDINNAARLLIGQAIKEEDANAALAHWNQVTQQAPGVSLPHALANSVASLLHTQWRDTEADELLDAYLKRLTIIKPSALLSSAELLGKKQPQLALTWLERLRNAHNLTAREEQHRNELTQHFTAAARSVAAPVPPVPPLVAPGAPVAPTRPIVPPPAPQVAPASRQLVIHVAIPTAIEEKGLRLTFPGNAVKLLPYASIKALAAAVIHEGGKPFLIIDLVLSDLMTERDVRLLRLDSRQYSAQKILPQSANAGAAFKQLASLLLQGSGARALPSADAAMGAPYVSHKTIAAFEQAIYNQAVH